MNKLNLPKQYHKRKISKIIEFFFKTVFRDNA